MSVLASSPGAADKAPGIDDILAAAARIRPFAHRTPVHSSRTLDAMFGCKLFFKCEQFQRAGAFKFRGAMNAVALLSSMAGSETGSGAGVATHSSGNHAAALALAARMHSIAAHIVMPEDAPASKKAAVREYGGRIEFCEPTLEAREQTLAGLVAKLECAVVHPYDDARVIAGQGTAAMELLDQVDRLDTLVAPLGGGGLLSGTLIATKSIAAGASVIGAEPEIADDAKRSLESGALLPPNPPLTVADGLRTALGERNFAILSNGLDGVLTASESSIVNAMRLLWERAKLLVEPSAAVPLACIMEQPALFKDQRVGIILSGGNVDVDRLPWMTGAMPPRSN
jgi:threonine dehydratase